MPESRQQRRARERAQAKTAARPAGPSPARLAAERTVRRTLGDHAHTHAPAGASWSWCPASYVEHRDGTERCELGDECLVGNRPEPHDEGGDCPGPHDGCEHCQQTYARCDALVVEHAGGRYVCQDGHDDEDPDVPHWHPTDEDTVPCPTPEACPTCAAASTPAAPPSTRER